MTRLYPTNHYLPGIRHVERLVPDELVGLLTAGPNPAFTTTRPEGHKDAEAPLEAVDDLLAEAPTLLGEHARAAAQAALDVALERAATDADSVTVPKKGKGAASDG